MTEQQKAAQLIFEGARRIEGGLRNIYGQWCKPPDPAFDEFMAPLFTSENRIEPSTLERLDVIAKEEDLSVIEEWGDSYPLDVMRLAYAYAASAADAATDGDALSGWQHLCSASFWYGEIDGREWGSWEQENHQQKHTKTKLVAEVRREFSDQGNIARHEKGNKLKDWTIDRYRTGGYSSRHEASHNLKDAAIAKAKELGTRLSPTRAQKTIYEWLLKADGE